MTGVKAIRATFDSARSSAEGPRSVWSAVGLVGSSVAMALVVFVLARQLGTADYGVYAGIGALVLLAAAFGGMGTRQVLLQRVTRDPNELPRAWGVLLAANVVVGVPLVAATVGLAALLLPGQDLVSVALIAIAEFISAGLVKGPAAAWVALDRFPLVAAVTIFDTVLRLVAACSLLVWTAEVRTLAIALLIVMSVGSIVVNLALGRTAGRPRFVMAELIDGCRKGAPFSVATVSGTVQSNIDQFMLLRARLEVDAGLYALGVRFIGYSMLPLHSLMSATVPEFFRRGHSGIGEGLRYGRRMAPIIAAISLGGAAVAVALASPIGRLFGDQFDGVFAVVLALSLFPLIRSMETLVASALLGSGHQSVVARVGLATAALNVALNVPLIPWLGWWGAVIATYVSEIVRLVVLWVAAQRLRRERDIGPGLAAPAG
jgi:O-antigen/teichoic acid export membrane protein